MNNSPTVIVGNVTADPELTYTADNQARCSFSVAVNYYWYNKDGDKQEKVSYFNVTAWRYTAENVARVLEKGIGVIVSGRLEQRSYEDKEGNNRSIVELIADEVAINTASLEAVTRRRREGASSDNGQTMSPRRSRPAVPAGVGADEEPF
jgi:single-strand DNA-binding protein